MDNMFEEFFKQGDMEKVLDLPISKFMDRENTNKEKSFSNYLNVVCRPLLSTFFILINDEEINTAIFKEGIDKNKKNLEHRIDGDSGKWLNIIKLMIMTIFIIYLHLISTLNEL